MRRTRNRARAPHYHFIDIHLTGRHRVNNSIRRIVAGLTITLATGLGTAVATTTAHADDTAATTVETVEDLPAPVTTIIEPVVAPLDTWWG